MKEKVGIVIVSYNAPDALAVTLESIFMAKNNKCHIEVFLLDNFSEKRSEIRMIAEMYDVVLVESHKNLGFSGGNNVGIKYFLDKSEFSRICLLNSDVVVPDYWLDDLVSCNLDVVSPVTNKADSEQRVYADYKVDLKEVKGITSPKGQELWQSVNRLYKLRKNLLQSPRPTEGDATYFCVLFSREVFEEVGLLDEVFFPGGFEDNDFNLRCENKGYKVYLARGVYVHHWGSASFGLLNRNYFQKHASKNQKYFEQKHSVKFNKRFSRVFTSLWSELQSIEASGVDLCSGAEGYLIGWLDELSDGVQKLLEDYRYMGGARQDHLDTLSRWASLSLNLRSEIIGLKRFSNFERDYTFIVEKISEIFEFNVKKHSSPFFKYNVKMRKVKGGVQQSVKLWNFFLGFKGGVVFFGGYCYASREKDGYFQRIRSIDQILSQFPALYFDSDSDVSYKTVDRISDNRIVLNVGSKSRRKRIVLQLYVLLCLLRGRVVYLHSILRGKNKLFQLLDYIPRISKILDVHGAVPEEFLYYDDKTSSYEYSLIEKKCAKSFDRIIVVSEEMRRFLLEKYTYLSTDRVIFLPILNLKSTSSQIGKSVGPKDNKNVIYAGGSQKWQQVGKMCRIVSERPDLNFLFYSPDVEPFKQELNGVSNYTLGSLPHEKVLEQYKKSSFGLILREDHILNRVACPTKLVEYIEYGVVPVMDSERLGGLVDLGLGFISYEDFLVGKNMASEYLENIRENNYVLLKRISNLSNQGREQLLLLFK